MDIDNNKIELILIISYTLKTLLMIIVILNLSFFFGHFWIMFCHFEEDILHDAEYKSIENPKDTYFTFITEYSLQNN